MVVLLVTAYLFPSAKAIVVNTTGRSSEPTSRDVLLSVCTDSCPVWDFNHDGEADFTLPHQMLPCGILQPTVGLDLCAGPSRFATNSPVCHTM